jgi:hypothetical protein
MVDITQEITLMISAIEQKKVGRTLVLLSGLCLLTVILGSCKRDRGRSKSDYLLERIISAEGRLNSLKSINGQYPTEDDTGDTFPALTTICKQWDLELTYSCPSDDGYTLIISPRKLSNKVLGCGDGRFARTYVITPEGICKIYVARDTFLPVTDSNVANWLREKDRAELAAGTQPTTQPANE